jgi:hypothetical protein
VAKDTADGKPVKMRVGADNAYWIWHVNETWYLRSTTKGNETHTFAGRVWSDDGTITGLLPAGTDLGNHVRLEKTEIGFAYPSHDALDGFDFRLMGKCVSFHLLMDSRYNGRKVFVGKGDRLLAPGPILRLCE